jgi:hypothetical protein
MPTPGAIRTCVDDRPQSEMDCRNAFLVALERIQAASKERSKLG